MLHRISLLTTKFQFRLTNISAAKFTTTVESTKKLTQKERSTVAKELLIFQPNAGNSVATVTLAAKLTQAKVNQEAGFQRALKAAEAGNVKAYRLVSSRYVSGKGTPVDLNKSFEWDLKAAEAGVIGAQIATGYSYETGRGVTIDLLEAFKWISLAAKRGDPVAELSCGYYHEKGLGVDVDLKKAHNWYSKSANKGNHSAVKMIARLSSRNTR